MKALPERLGWGALFASVPELEPGLGPWLPRLAAAIGPLRASTHAAHGEPDGFLGIGRRGPYERLLPSEWLLAEEAPDEFARRAAEHEHAFFQLARRDQAGALSTVALFDCGPEQLGLPRLVQLAAWVVLARRAEAVGAQLRWGVLQDPERRLGAEADPSAVRGFLTSRSAHPVDAADVGAWAEVLTAPGRGAPADDVWILGPPGPAPALGRPVSRLSSDDLRSLDSVEVEVLRPGRPAVRLTLARPPERSAIRLLRDPFAAPTPAPAPRPRVPLGAPLDFRFTPNPPRLLVRTDGGKLVVVPVPSPNRDPGHVRELDVDGPRVIAAGADRRSLYVVAAGEGRLEVRELNRRGRTRWRFTSAPWPEALGQWIPGRDAPLGELVVVETGLGGRALLFRDGAERLFRLALRSGAEIEPLSWGAVWLRRSAGRAVALLDHRGQAPDDPEAYLWPPASVGGRELVVVERSGAPSPQTEPALAHMPRAAESLVGHSGWLQPQMVDLFGFRSGPGSWTLRDRRRTEQIRVPIEAEAVGLTGKCGRDWTPAVVLLSGDRRSFVLATAQHRRPLLDAARRVRRARVSPDAPLLAYATDDDVLAIFSLVDERMLREVQLGAPLEVAT